MNIYCLLFASHCEIPSTVSLKELNLCLNIMKFTHFLLLITHAFYGLISLWFLYLLLFGLAYLCLLCLFLYLSLYLFLAYLSLLVLFVLVLILAMSYFSLVLVLALFVCSWLLYFVHIQVFIDLRSLSLEESIEDKVSI